MSFVLGFVLGLIVGCVLMHLAHEWLDTTLSNDAPEEKTWLGRKCPPCDGECKQGRDCPAGEKR